MLLTLRVKNPRLTPTQVREIRESLGMTQQEFAGEVGVHRITVVRWERGFSPVGLPESNAIRALVELRDRGAA